MNTQPAPEVQVDCICGGRNPACPKCYGDGWVMKKSCRRCGGTGKDGSKCPDCRGLGWRDLDQGPL